MTEKDLPESWVISKVEDVAIILDNMRKPVNSKERALRKGDIPYYGATGQTGWIDDFIFDEELVLLGEDGAPFFDLSKNVAYLIDGKSWVNNHAHVLKAIENITVNGFLLHYLNQFDYKGFVGGTTRLKLNQGNLRKIPFPLPPLSEQKRIVAKLDQLFGHLEVLKAKLERIPNLLVDFRQSVLTQAVTGKLTEEWRVGKKVEKWQEVKLSELVKEKPRNGYSPKGVKYETPVKSLTLSATTSGKFDGSYVKYLDIPVPAKDSYLWLKKGDILIQRSNSLDYVGTSAIYDQKDDEFIYPDLMMKVKVNEKVINHFLHYSLSEKKVKNYFKANATGTAGNMPKINQGVVLNTSISLPPLKEQNEIVRRVESLFFQADTIETRYQNLKEKIDNLPKAILAKAFKGELVPQDLADESAAELLKKIKAEKSKGIKTKRRKSSTPKRTSSKHKEHPSQVKIDFQDKQKPDDSTSQTEATDNKLKAFQARIDELIETPFFKWLKNFEQEQTSFEELENQVSSSYDDLAEDLLEALSLTEAGMRPGIKQIYDEDKKQMVFIKMK